MVCEFCGGMAEQLARTHREIWVGCRRCHRTWKEDAARQAIAPSRNGPAAPPEAAEMSLARGTALAVASVALAFTIRMALKPIIAAASPFLLFTPAVMLAAFYGGTVPGVVATGLGALLGNHFFLAALGEPGLERWDRVALFVVVGALITWFADATRKARARLSASLWREQTARAEAEAANQAKDEFLALVSHELQTPTSVILGWASIVRSRDLDRAALDRALETIERNARLQSRLVADVLDTSRIVTGTLRLDRRIVDLGRIVAAAAEQVRPAADARRLRLDLEAGEGEAAVLGDSVRLQQVFTNLLTNAVKFTPEGGRIHVQTAVGARDVQVSVTDTGVGIAPEFLPRIFQRFEQDAATVSHSRAGLGLGLSIARHFVERHNGTITVRSAGRNRGTTFTVTLPRQKSASWEDASRHHLAPDALRSVSVLVVEDDEDTRAMVIEALERFGAQVTAVDSAEAARPLVSRLHPDVLICDLRLPQQDGVALMQSVRSDPDKHVSSMPAASMTASVRPEDRERALAAGYQVHLQKPIDPDELASVVVSLTVPRARTSGLVH